MELIIVDVFAEQPLAGNQLAVVRQASALSDDQMQAIAREMNFSETTFVTEQAPDRATVRIFTPDRELPFAGHPTLGTAWVLADGRGEYILDLQAGAVPVVFKDGITWMTPPPVKLNSTFPRAQAAALIGLSSTDLDERYPVRFAEVGPQFLLIGLNSLTALKKAKLDETLYQQHLKEGQSMNCLFMFTHDSYSTATDYASRMFFYSGNFREDPATGSANSAFAAYLKDLEGASASSMVIVEQGVEINRPSKLYLKIADTIQVGGKVQGVSKGEFYPGILTGT